MISGTSPGSWAGSPPWGGSAPSGGTGPGARPPAQGASDHWSAQGREYEVRVLTIPRDHSRSQARELLTGEAEHGRWEVARSIIYVGGERRVWLRRKIIRARSTLNP